MNCHKCGKDNPPNAMFCSCCGAPMRSQNTSQNHSNDRERKKRTEIIIIVLSVVLAALLIVITGAVVFNRSSSRNTSINSGKNNEPVSSSALSANEDETVGRNTEDIYKAEREDGKEAKDAAVEAAVAAAKEAAQEAAKEAVEEAAQEAAKEAAEKAAKEATKRAEQEMAEKKKRMEKKDTFRQRAEEIEEYAWNYLDTAMTQSEINSESSIVYKKWDALLNDVYQYLKKILPESEFKALKSDELDWIAEKEAAIEEAGAEWAGGSGEPMARNTAGIEYTQERCYYLISLIN